MRFRVLACAAGLGLAVGACQPAGDGIPGSLEADLPPAGRALVFRNLDDFSRKFADRDISLAIYVEGSLKGFESCTVRLEFYRSGGLVSSYDFASWSRPGSSFEGRFQVIDSVAVPHPEFDQIRLQNIRCANVVKGRPVRIVVKPEMWE